MLIRRSEKRGDIMAKKSKYAVLLIVALVGYALNIPGVANSDPLSIPQVFIDQYAASVFNNAATGTINSINSLANPSVRSSLFNGKLIHLAYKNAFVFSPRKLRWTVYDSQGRALRSGRASGGKGYCADVRRSCRTPVGHFRVQSRRGANCVSSKYPLGKGGASMAYCTFFRGHYAIHGTNDLPDYNASHGCIRVSPSAAKWLSRNYLYIGARVIVLPY